MSGESNIFGTIINLIPAKDFVELKIMKYEISEKPMIRN